MNSLNFKHDPPEYYRVMEKRIKYYAEKYDPHTRVIDGKTDPGLELGKGVENRRKGIIDVYSVFLSIF